MSECANYFHDKAPLGVIPKLPQLPYVISNTTEQCGDLKKTWSHRTASYH